MPSHVQRAEMFVLLDITQKQVGKSGQSQELGAFGSATMEEYQFVVTVSRPAQQDEKPPSMLTTLESALSEEAFSDSVIEQCLISAKAEWMNKVKVLFKFRRTGQRSQEDLNRLLSVLHVNPEDRQLTQFWMRGLGHQYRTRLLMYGSPAPSTEQRQVNDKKSDKPAFSSSMV